MSKYAEVSEKALQLLINIEKAAEMPENQFVTEELVSAFHETFSADLEVEHRKHLARTFFQCIAQKFTNCVRLRTG